MTNDEIEELRDTKIENRLVLHNIYAQEESPSPTKTESDFRPGDLIGFRPEKPDLQKSFKKSGKHTRHYPVEMSSGFLSLANDYLSWVLKNHPNCSAVSSHQFIAERAVELVSADVFSPAEIMKNMIRRNVRKAEILSNDTDFILPTSLHTPDGAAMYRFDNLLDDDKKDEEYKRLYEDSHGSEESLPTNL